MAAFQLVDADVLFTLMPLAGVSPSALELAAAQRVTALLARLGPLRDAGREADTAALAAFRQRVERVFAAETQDAAALAELAALDIEPTAHRLFPPRPYRIGEALLKPLFTLERVLDTPPPSAAQLRAAGQLQKLLDELDRRIGVGGMPQPDWMRALRDRAERALTFPKPDDAALNALAELDPVAEAQRMFAPRVEVWIEDSSLETPMGPSHARQRSAVVAAEARDPSMLRIRYDWVPNAMLSPEEQALYTELLKAEFLLRAICLDPQRRLEPLSAIQGPQGEGFRKAATKASARVFNLRNEMVSWWGRSDVFRRLLLRLKYIAKETLVPSPPRTALAEVLLQGLQEDARLAVVRHRKTRRFLGFLGALLLGLAVIGLTLYGIRTGFGEAVICGDFGLPGCGVSWRAMIYFIGTAIGAWLSFVQRNLSAEALRAEQDLDALRTLLADSMHPLVRAAYLFGFAFIVLLLLQERILQVSLGPEADLAKVLARGHVALLAGLLIGLAERTLPTMVARPVQALSAAAAPSAMPAAPGSAGPPTTAGSVR